jgi:diguanylate cyclase
MGLTFVFNVMLRNFYRKQIEQIAFGLMFGVAIVIGMTHPISFGDGLIFDTRTLLLASAVAFVGPVAGLIALAIGIGCRVIIGGAGMLSGVVGLVLAFVIAIAWDRYVSPRIKNRVVSDALLGCAVTFSVAALFVLPADIAWGIFQSIAPTLLLCNILGTVAVGFMFRREVRYVVAAKQFETHASTDPLTNLLNRRGFDKMTGTMKHDPLSGHALFYFDIDNFKHINDTYGHDAGDAALAIIAARISENLRNGSVFSRQGGDEFSIYMPSIAEKDVKGVADRICNMVSSDPIKHNDSQFKTGISMGGYWTRADTEMQSMIDRADSQLLLAKRAGKNRAQIRYDHVRATNSAA